MSHDSSAFASNQEADHLVVTVSYLRLDRDDDIYCHPEQNPGALIVTPVSRPTVHFYRYLYDTVGQDCIWWRRRVMSDGDLLIHLHDESTGIYVLYGDGQPLGFFELDRRPHPDIDLAYFGLMPSAVGRGLGRVALRLALDTAWSLTPRAITVNTCTSDHPRALGMYLQAGFKLVRSAIQEWHVPRRLGFSIPDHLRAAP